MADPFQSSYTNVNSIKIIFDPADSAKATACQQIVDVQFSRMLADGEMIMPGTYYSGFAYQDAYTTDAGWCIDALADERTPDYQQGQSNQWNQVGRKNGGSVDAFITDAPTTAGGDKGFQSSSNPNGWETVVYEFYTFCWCMKGDQCDAWYEGFKWTYTKTAADQSAGRKGTSTIVQREVADLPASLLDAFNKFNQVNHFIPCS